MPTITPLDASFGAVVTDIKVADMDAAEWRAVEDAFHEYAALVFPDQHPSEEEQIAFGERFGDIELLRPDPTKKAVPITNLKEDGSLYTKDEFRFKTLRGNEGWHTDSSYMPLAAKASILSAIQVPSKGGETALSDMRDAYDKLDAETRDKIEGIIGLSFALSVASEERLQIQDGRGLWLPQQRRTITSADQDASGDAPKVALHRPTRL